VGQASAGIETVNTMMRADRDSLRRQLFARPHLNTWLATTNVFFSLTDNLTLLMSKPEQWGKESRQRPHKDPSSRTKRSGKTARHVG
jgi:hypothetical protein